MPDNPNPPRRGPVLIEYGAPRPGSETPPVPKVEGASAIGTSEAVTPAAADNRDARIPRAQGDNRHARAPRLESAEPGPSPADAPMIDDGAPLPGPTPRTMDMVTRVLGSGPSGLTRFFLNTGAALLTFILSIMALRFFDNLMAAHPLVGWIGIVLFGLFTVAALGMGIREFAAWRRFARIDKLHRDAADALSRDDMAAAREVVDHLDRLYARRAEMAWPRQTLAERRADAFDTATLLAQAEGALLAQLDQQARREIEAAARTVAAATALVPLALADVMAALVANLRMIRRIAEIYGGRAGAVGGWRLARTVIAHLLATGAVAAGDDLIHTVAGGGVLSRLSRRFGEGIINGALTARVGVAAMEVCRPLPFIHQPRPKVGNLVSRGLKGLFGEEKV